MAAQLPEAEAGGVAATLAVAPTVAEPSGAPARLDAQPRPHHPRRADRRSCSSCASSGRCSGPCPRRPAATSSTPTSRRSPPGTRSAPTRSATTSGRGCSTAGATRWRSRSPSTSSGSCSGACSARFAAFWGSFADTVIMRVLDVLIAFPSLVLALAIAQSLGPSKLHTIYALCFFSVPAFARLARAADAAPARAAVHARRAAGGHARRRGSCCATSRPTSCPRSSPSACSGWA